MSKKTSPLDDSPDGALLAAPADTAPAQADTAKGKDNKKNKRQTRGKPKAKAKARVADDGDDPVIGPPFKLTYRWKPADKAQCYLCGTVCGWPKKFITGVSVQQNHHFVKIMGDIAKEAEAGAFTTKGDVVHRRDELLKAQADTAEHADTDEQAKPAATSEIEGAEGLDVD